MDTLESSKATYPAIIRDALESSRTTIRAMIRGWLLTHGPDKITYGSRCLAFRNRRSVRLNGRTSGPGCRVELFGASPWVEVRLPRELG